jgi:RNA polymerase sigma-70 factor (ECF subfamily)
MSLVSFAALAEPVSTADEAMARYAAGDEAAFAVLYDEMAPRLFGYLRRHARSQAQAEDLLQQTMLNLHRARGSFISGAAVTPWAFAIARRLLIDGIRKEHAEVWGDAERAAEPATAETSAHELASAKQTAARLEQALRRLPEQHRVAFELVKQDGLSVRDAAQVLGCTVTAVKLRAHRAYVALRAALGDLVE